MTRFEVIPMARIKPRAGEWLDLAYQGPSGCYGVHRVDLAGLPVFQVARIDRDSSTRGTPTVTGVPSFEPISEPFMTPEGAKQFAQRLAAAGHGHEEVTRYG